MSLQPPLPFVRAATCLPSLVAGGSFWKLSAVLATSSVQNGLGP